jgi:hypothetical protein
MSQTWDQAKLERVHQKHTPPPLGKTIGALISEEDVATLGGDARAREVFEALAGAGDADFRRLCRFGAFRSGELTLLVEDPAEVYGQRTRWSAALIKHLQAACPQARVRKVVFREESGGAVLSQPVEKTGFMKPRPARKR